MNNENAIRDIGEESAEFSSARKYGRTETSANLDGDAPETTATYTIKGKPRGGGWKTLPASFFVCLGCWILYGVVTSTGKADDATGLVCLLAGISILVGFAIPCNAHTYLDLTRRELIRESRYAGIPVSRCRLPFADFQAIVVRHLVHDSEGESSYTGSVGLKPVDGGKVVWLKDFPASADEIPAEARAYALELRRISGILLKP